MNKTYRLIWNELNQSWVAVSEIARSRGKRSSKALILAAALSAVLPPPAFAQVPPAPTTLPTGGNVVAGTANVTQNNAVMNINQSSQRAAIDWNTFNVGAAATVNFNQPSASAVTLNRVADPNPSQIFGRINANGQVFLSNPNGVVFGPSASLDVGGLVATTHRIGLDDFMAGKTTFSRDGATGSIINEGELKSKLGGYIALLAPGVRNQGVIVANMGTVALAAGETFELQFDANNTLAGLRVTSSTMKAMIDNKSVVLAPGGLIILSAKAVNGIQSGVINNSGLIEATGLTKRGGRIILEASNSIENTGTLSANASTTGPAGSVSLSAPEVVNSGTITATGTAEPSDSSNPESNQTGSNDGGRIQINAGHFKQTAEALLDAHAATKGGTVTLAASSKIELAGQVDVSAVAQESNNASGGEITAQAAQIDLTSATLDASGGQGGRITLDASGTQSVVTGTPATPAPPDPLPVPERGKLILSGTTQLSTRGRRGTGGDQTLLGDHIGLNDTTALDATGATGGGSVRVGGGWQGSGGYYQATTVKMQAGTRVDVSATQSGNGGTAVLWSDVRKADSVTTVAGSIFAKGGAEGGDGGKVETSGHTLAIDGASVSAAAGQGGTAGDWLLDPTNITVTDGGGAEIGGSSMDADVITTALNGGTSVTLSADLDITVNEAINWSSNQKLTLTAGDEIYVNAAISNTNLSAGGVYFQTSSAYNKVIFGGSGNVVIYNPEQLQWVNTALKGKYTLGSNIDMTGITFVPIGSAGGAFSGFFDGLNHTISNLTITASTTEATGDFQGLFGYAYDPTIENTGLVNVSITGRDYVGGLVGASVSTGYVGNCYVTGTGTVTGRNYTGGLIGYQFSNSVLYHSYATVSVSGRGGVGGLVGYSADSLIDTSYATGRVDGAYGVGGLVGLNAGAGTINQTYSTGYVAATTTDNVGGLLGFQAAGAATNFSFWDDYTSGRTTSAGGTRATTAQMKDNFIYANTGWSISGFSSGWYPIFRTDGGGVWQIAKPIVYTIPTPSSTYTYTGGSQLPTNWTADVIFGTDYNNWTRGSDYVLKQNGNIITSYTNAGTYENITIDIIKVGYNEASAGNTNGTFAISKAPLTLSASNATKVYGDANPAFTTTLSGFVAGQTMATSGVSGAGSASSLATATSNVGTTYAITPTLGTLSATNYAVTNFVDGALSVTPKAVTLTATKVYDGTTDLTGDVTITTGVGTQTLTYTGATASDAHVSTAGKYVSALTLADATDGSGGLASNYALPTLNVTNAPVTINPKQLTATASITAVAKTYDGLLAAIGSTVSGDVSGVVGTDALTLDTSGVSLAYSDAHVATANKTIAATGNVALGSLTSTGSGLANGSNASNLVASAATDYVLSAQPAIQSVAGSIIAKQLTVTASITAAAKTYDGTLTATGSTVSGDLAGELNGDSIALDTSGLTLAFSDAHVATANKNISATGNVALGSLTAGGVGSKDGTAGNAVAGLLSDYALAAQPTISPAAGTINAKTLTSSISNSNITKVYDGTTNAPSGFTPTWSIDGLLSGDTAATLAYSGAAYNSANVASANTLTVSGLNVSGITGDKGSQASDYALDATSKDVGATISKATLTVRADNDAKFVTQADTANFAGVSYSGFMNGEGAGVLGGTAAVTRTNAGTETANVYSGVLQASGLTADNYQFSYVNGDFTIVPSSQLLVRVTDVSNTYGSASNYSIVNASYWNGTSEVVLATPTANGGNNYTVNDGAGGSATFTLAPSGATNSSAGFIKVGRYQLATSGTVTENSGNFSDTVTVVGSHQVNTKALTASATGGISKTYDGTTSMSGVTLALTGKETNDGVTVGGQGAFSDKNATVNLSYTFNNLVLSGNDAGNYYLTGGGSFTGNDGQILRKTVTLNPQAASRDYNGATAYTPSASDLAYLTSLLGVSGDSVNAATLSYDSKNVGIGKTLSLSAATISDGNSGNNYTITLGSNASSAITRIASVTWVGPASGGDWFNPANWANGAVPDLSNVANVVIPNGSTPVFGTTVVVPAESGPVNLDSIGTDGGLIQNGGTLNLGGGGMTLNTFTQGGGTLSSSGNIALTNFNQTGGTTTTAGGGDFTVNGGFSQGTSGSVTVNGNTSITDTSGGTVIGNLNTNGSTTIHSTGGDVTQANGTAIISNGSTTLNASNGGAKADITLNGSGNNFVGPFNADAQNITVADGADGLNLGNITAIGKLDATAADIDLSGTVNVTSLDLEAISGNITQSNGTLTVTSGPTNFKANGNITLDKANSINGSVTATATTGTITISTTGTTATTGTEIPFIPAPTPPTQIPGAVGDPSTNGTPGTQGGGLVLPPIPQQSSGLGNSGSDSASGEGGVTQVGTGGISISLDSSPSAGSGLTALNSVVLTVSVPRAMVTANTGFSFEVPAQVRERIGSAEAVATRADGTALPDWLRFNPATLRFEAGAVPSSGLPLQVLISTNNTQVLIIISERQE